MGGLRFGWVGPRLGGVATKVLVGWWLIGLLAGRVVAQEGAPAPETGGATGMVSAVEAIPMATGKAEVVEGAPAPLGRVDGFALEAAAGEIDFRTLDIPGGAGQAVLVATVEKTFTSESARPSLTARLASEDKAMQRVVSLKMVDGPLDPLVATTFEVRGAGVDGKREDLGRRQPVGQKFDLTFAWGAGRLEIRLDGAAKYRGEIDFVPKFFHVQMQSGRAAVESVQFEEARFMERGPAPARRARR